MATLKNAKHELFAQALASGKGQAESYAFAGYDSVGSSANACASRLAKSVKVARRIVELRDRLSIQPEFVLSKAWVIEQTISIMREARENKAYGPAAKCSELLGREVLAFVERKEIGGPGDFDALSDDELIDIVRGSRRANQSRQSRKGIGEAGDEEEMPEPSRVH